MSAVLRTDAEKTAHIKQVVLAEGQRLRQAHPWLKRQDALGALIMAASLAGMVGSGWLYAIGVLPWWVCLPLSAIFASFIHELEHDLIHWMYFRQNKPAHHLMMALCWLSRPGTINPWIRRKLHFEHHKHSGTHKDLEERGITNGQPYSLKRLLMMSDWLLALWLRVPQMPTRKRQLLLGLVAPLGYFPMGWIHLGLWYAFLAFHLGNAGAALLGSEIAWSAGFSAAQPWITLAVVTWVGPNQLRMFCLHFVSSTMHYYGDVEDDNPMQQTQVLNPGWLLPFQLFCFNFGSTHAIHHFVVKEPFYIRQWTAPVAHRVMREMGVRFNDTATFKRANRFGEDATAGA
ncbi:MAG TPA: fatty acid desaturase [Nevskiaceae bacterium]|nr:fatty acid desaturase [Nevskiaceae bacterium]